MKPKSAADKNPAPKSDRSPQQKGARSSSTEPNKRGTETKRMQSKHIVVIDDDPLFCARIQQAAKKRDIMVTVCKSLRELQTFSSSNEFDVALVDYFLDDLHPRLIGSDVASLIASTPVILMSSSNRGVEDGEPFPPSVRRFVNKMIGIDAILDSALAYPLGAPEKTT